jgi:1,4-alpha-glucan branching enzyme
MVMRSTVMITTLALAVLPACATLAPRTRAPGPAVAADGVHFAFFAPAAHRVQIGGSWPENNWARGDGAAGEANIGLMTDEDGDGTWEITVPLPPGRHRYAFWVDEATWQVDPGNPEQVEGGPGGRASSLVLVARGETLEIR